MTSPELTGTQVYQHNTKLLEPSEVHDLFFDRENAFDTLCALIRHNKCDTRDTVFEVLRVALTTPIQLQLCVNGVTLFRLKRLMLPYTAMSRLQKTRLYAHVQALKDDNCFSGTHDFCYYYVTQSIAHKVLVYANSVNVISAFITLVQATATDRLCTSTREFISVMLNRLVACSNLNSQVIAHAYTQSKVKCE